MGVGCRDKGYEKPGYKTVRQFCAGEEYFGSFSRSIYTFFQVLTGESWSEMVARPVIWFYHDDAILAVGAALFFVSFILVTQFVLINVVVAVLLDKMTSSEEAEEAEETLDDADPAAALDDAERAPPPPEPPLTTEERKAYRRFQEVSHSLEKLASWQTNVQGEIGRTKGDMVALKEQLGSLAKAVDRLPKPQRL